MLEMKTRQNNEKESPHSTFIDLHCHTSNSPDSSLHLETVLNGLSGKVNGLCITDHDIISRLQEDTIKALEDKYQLLIISQSVEISSKDGHILAYGITSVPSFGLPAKDVIEIIHSDGGIAAAAHPFDFFNSLGDLVYQLDLDALEVNGSRAKVVNQKAREAAELMGMPLIGGSDSHRLQQVGKCVTQFNNPINNVNDLIEEIKKGFCKPKYLY
jgi:hypothetical protein